MKQKMADYLSQNHHRQMRKKIVGVLACLVVLCTIYALIFPGLTLENTPKCGKDEHIHSETCYNQIVSVSKTALVCPMENVSPHIHTDACLNENGEYCCGYADCILHTHDDSCFDEYGNLWCPLSENVSHIHMDECYDENGLLICDRMEIFPHEHNESCYDEEGYLICGLLQVEEHVHDQNCFQIVEEPVDTESLTCSLAEGEGAHFHSMEEGCYDEEGNLICPLQEYAGHQHNFLCYGTWEQICDLEEHVHDQSCFDYSEDESEGGTESEPQGGSEGGSEAEGDAAAGTEDESEELAESKDESEAEDDAEADTEKKPESEENDKDGQETDEKEKKEQESDITKTPGTFVWEDDTKVVTVTLSNPEALPAEAEFHVDDLTKKEYESYKSLIIEQMLLDNKTPGETKEEKIAYAQQAMKDLVLYNMYFLYDGKEIEPDDAEISVKIENKLEVQVEDVSEQENKEKETVYTAVHIKETKKGEQVVDVTDRVKTNDAGNVESVELTTDSFSVFGVYGMRALAANDGAEDGIYTDKIFTDVVGPYSLENVLKDYNIVSFGNVKMGTHCMGGVLIAGDFTGGASGFSDSAFVTKPSYVGGKIEGIGPHNSRTAKSGVDLYVGNSNTVHKENDGSYTVNGKGNYNPKGSVYITDNFIDWNQLKGVVEITSAAMAERPEQKTITISDHWESISIEAGSTVTLDTGGNKIAQITLGGTSSNATIINLMGTEYTFIPKILGLNTAEDGTGMPIIFNFPNAVSVTIPSDVTPVFGHIVAPNAKVIMPTGNYNGCIVCKECEIGGEGHLWPYNGGELIPTKKGFKAAKHISGDTPKDGEKFDFILEKLTENGSWISVQTVENSGSEVAFNEITYDKVGTHWYRILENQDKTVAGIKNTKVQYLVKVDVTKEEQGDDTIYSSTQTYYRVDENSEVNLDGVTLSTIEAVAESLTEVNVDDVIFDNERIPQDETISITVKKVWLNSNDEEEVSIPNNYVVSFDLYQKTVDSIPSSILSSEELSNEWELYDNYTITIPSVGEEWKTVVEELPKSSTDVNNQKTYYIYKIVETSVAATGGSEHINEYDISYVPDDATMTVTIKNKKKSSDYILPETGGSGTTPYTAAGLGIMLMAGFMYTIKSRKGGRHFFKK